MVQMIFLFITQVYVLFELLYCTGMDYGSLGLVVDIISMLYWDRYINYY